MTSPAQLCLPMVPLPGTGRVTTRLGFGASALMSGQTDKAASFGLLEAAYDAGIRHFDVAPMYGLGSAESCVGEFLSRHRQDTTVTTKFGILPPENATLLNLARKLGGPVLRRFPRLRKRIVQGAEASIPSGRLVAFTAKAARKSLDASLSKLQVERIDLWLLHEVQAENLNDEGLLLFLQQVQAEGKVGSFGVGSESSKIPALLQKRAAYCPVVQFEWSALDASPLQTRAFEIHHRSLTDRFRQAHTELRRNAALCRRWSDNVGRDLGNGQELAALLLKIALERNPGGIVLFSSKDPKHIMRNARVAEDATLSLPALTLYKLLQAEGSPDLQSSPAGASYIR